ncbi:MAG: hypothetical protein HUJ68_02030 [Clostridia bacterium]|nr:hypothetical protein [Clostridia bacterium]
MKNQKGITLIALVITIIVLLILAGVSIAMLTGDNGILGKATEAASESKISEDKEAAALDLNAAYTAYMEAKYNTTPPTTSTFKAWLKTNSSSYMKDTDHYTYDSDNGKITTVNKNKRGLTETAIIDDNGGHDGFKDTLD